MTTPESHTSVDECLRQWTHQAEEEIRGNCRRCCEYARDSPAKAMATAAVAGYLLHYLPLRRLLIAKVRVASKLLPPLFLAYGAARTWELLGSRRRETTRPQ